MVHRLDNRQGLAADLSMGTSQLPGRDVLDRARLAHLDTGYIAVNQAIVHRLARP